MAFFTATGDGHHQVMGTNDHTGQLVSGSPADGH